MDKIVSIVETIINDYDRNIHGIEGWCGTYWLNSLLTNLLEKGSMRYKYDDFITFIENKTNLDDVEKEKRHITIELCKNAEQKIKELLELKETIIDDTKDYSLPEIQKIFSNYEVNYSLFDTTNTKDKNKKDKNTRNKIFNIVINEYNNKILKYNEPLAQIRAMKYILSKAII